MEQCVPPLDMLTTPSVVHSSKDIWGDDADQWNPERWLSGDTKKLDRNWIVVSP
jgi:hypothetical protein